MGEIVDLEKEKVANPVHPEHRTAPRPGLDEIVAFLVAERNFEPAKAWKIADEFYKRWRETGHPDTPDVTKFILFLEGEL